MKARVLFIRSLPLVRDARSSKMVNEYRRRGYRVLPLIWSRGSVTVADADTVTCMVKSGYGRGFWGVGARFGWIWFISMHMIRRRRDYDVVHVVDFDTGFIAVPLARLLCKPVIYDAFDHITAMTTNPAGTLLARTERVMIRRAALTIFPDPIRLKQYGVTADERTCIIGNIPSIHGNTGSETKLIPPAGEALRLVYIGTLEARHRGLEYLPLLCAQFNNQIEVIVGGMGELDSYFKATTLMHPNLYYIGHQDYDAALSYMTTADCLYGPYLLSAPAHRYASPNKLYEHLALGKPLITNTGTPPADLVARLDSGFLFDGTFDNLYSLLTKIDRATCRIVGERAKCAWLHEFSGLREMQLQRFFDLFDNVTRSVVRA